MAKEYLLLVFWGFYQWSVITHGHTSETKISTSLQLCNLIMTFFLLGNVFQVSDVVNSLLVMVFHGFNWKKGHGYLKSFRSINLIKERGDRVNRVSKRLTFSKPWNECQGHVWFRVGCLHCFRDYIETLGISPFGVGFIMLYQELKWNK